MEGLAAANVAPLRESCKKRPKGAHTSTVALLLVFVLILSLLQLEQMHLVPRIPQPIEIGSQLRSNDSMGY
jgi:hypothetical protein